ncbi:MAG: type II toxin-antitoxin system VapC family toxin [Chloroflexi bacterium]|nr:type II toxin-antitoxin system VapC family toxin [Chloroflexota bacterium]
MMPYYLDTSALIKHYVAEPGSQWVEAVVFEPDDALLLTSRVTMVEVWSALARRRREISISSQDHADALAAFREDCLTRYHFVEFEMPVVELAGQLLDRHPLRAYDAVQLASALIVSQTLSEAGFPALTFLSADDRLLAIARAEELLTDNPNLPP